MGSFKTSDQSATTAVLSDFGKLLTGNVDPEPGWATMHPDRALAFLYVFPHPCDALDELMNLPKA